LSAATSYRIARYNTRRLCASKCKRLSRRSGMRDAIAPLPPR
jgi:hypothetical protein